MNQAQVEKCNKIADFLHRRITFLPNTSGHPWGRTAWQQQLPALEQFAKDLMADAEFRSLQLGTWLGTTDGEVIETAARMVIPPFYRPEYDLAVHGLKLAARLQQQQGQQVAEREWPYSPLVPASLPQEQSRLDAVPPESTPEVPTGTVSPSDDELRQLAERLDAAATGVKDTYGLVARIDLTDDEREGPMSALVMAFQYGQARDSKPGEAYFTKLLGYEDGSRYPLKLAAVPAEVAELWDRASAVTSAPLTRARLHDLCFEGRWGRVGDHARLAGEAYLDLAGELAQGEASDQLRAVRALRQCEALRRARVLARLTGQVDLGKRAAGAIIDALRDVLATDPLDLGRAIVLLEMAIDERLPGQEIEDLLTLLRVETKDIFFTERVIRFQLDRAPNDEIRANLQRDLVEAWMQEAERSDPARRTWNLTTAAARARDFGINDLLAQLTSKLQQTKLEDHGLVQHRASVPIDGAEAEAYVRGFLDQPSWREALLLLIANDPPTGKLERNRANAEEIVRIAPLTATLPATLLGADGLPRFTAATDEEKAELRLIRCELAQLQVLGSFVAEILQRIGVKWGPIPVEDLAAFLGESVHVAPPVSATLARAFNRYFQDDFEAAGYTAAPQIERSVRDIVLAVNEPAYRLQRGKTPGQYAGLGALLPVLQRAGVNESWLRFLQTVFAATAGMNFRNDLLHGFVDEIYAGHAALVLPATLYLTRGIILEAAPADPRGSQGDDPVTDSPGGERLPVLELGGGWCAALLTADQWREAVSSGPLQRFAGFDPSTSYVYVISKTTLSSQPIETESVSGTFVAPLGVPEDTPEALYVALINAQAHEALEWVQIDGKPYFDPHAEVGDYVLERTLTKWLEWKTGKRVVLEELD